MRGVEASWSSACKMCRCLGDFSLSESLLSRKNSQGSNLGQKHSPVTQNLPNTQVLATDSRAALKDEREVLSHRRNTSERVHW